MSDPDDISESVDGDVLGEDALDADQPGVGSYPPDYPLGAEDPTLFHADDLDTEAHLRRYTSPTDDVPEVVLVEEHASTRDVEKDLVAEAFDVDGRRYVADEFSAEEAAMHVIHDESDNEDRP